MKQSIEDQYVTILQSRAHISRVGRLFTFEDLAHNWGISKITLYRYISPDYRELSRKDSYKQRTKLLLVDKTKCYKCQKSLEDHARCPYCTILIHDRKCDCEERMEIIQAALLGI